MNQNQTMAEKFYLKYEWMANNYANQIFNYKRFGYQYDDLLQELRIKIYTSILSYAKKWQEYKQTNRYKPVPLKFYIKTALINRTKDFIKQFNQEIVENVDKIPIENFDYGIYSTMDSKIDLSKLICTINGIDLFYQMVGNQRRCFALFLKGFPIYKLNKIFPKLEVSELINKQIDYLKCKKSDFIDYNTMNFKTIMFNESIQ